MNVSNESTQVNDEVFKRRLFFQFLRTCDLFKRCLDIKLRSRGTNRIRFDVLNTLSLNNGPMTPTAISKKVYRNQNSITSVLDTLQMQGLIRRELSRQERRSFNIFLTAKGRKHIKKNTPYAQAFISEIISCWEGAQDKQMYFLLKEMREHLLNIISKGLSVNVKSKKARRDKNE